MLSAFLFADEKGHFKQRKAPLCKICGLFIKNKFHILGRYFKVHISLRLDMSKCVAQAYEGLPIWLFMLIKSGVEFVRNIRNLDTSVGQVTG